MLHEVGRQYINSSFFKKENDRFIFEQHNSYGFLKVTMTYFQPSSVCGLGCKCPFFLTQSVMSLTKQMQTLAYLYHRNAKTKDDACFISFLSFLSSQLMSKS